MIRRNDKRKKAVQRYVAIASRLNIPMDRYIDLLDSNVAYINMHAQKLEKRYEQQRN